MKLFIILICLFSERYLIHKLSYHRFFWFNDYCNTIQVKLKNQSFFNNPWALLLILVLPPILIFSLVYSVFHTLLFGLFGFLLSLLVFYYCLGPINLFYPAAQEKLQPFELIGQYFNLINRQLFSAVFWFLLAGPIGVLFYRLVALCAAVPAVTLQANEILDLMEWVPTRITVFLFLIVGNFQKGYQKWVKSFLAKPDYNHIYLTDAGLAALQMSESEEPSMVDAEKLVEHAIVVMLVLIALFTLIYWA